MLKYNNVRFVELSDWDDLVRSTYGKPYSFQQQNGCRGRGIYSFTVPELFEDDYPELIPEKINGSEMGINLKSWLLRDPKEPVEARSDDFYIKLFWHRNFYPNIHVLANDLYQKGLIEKGDYIINIDW